jgi:hypothetical protein
MKLTHISKTIQKAADVVGKTWPLYSFVTSNPLSGYEKAHFKEAVLTAKHYLNACVYPKAEIFKHALYTGEIDPDILSNVLIENKYLESTEFYLGHMEDDISEQKNPNHELDRIMCKWLAAFMDEGLAEWQMPGKEKGFYSSWRKLATYDKATGIKSISDIPESSTEALAAILEEYPLEQHEELVTQHLAALPGWTGYINYRIEAGSDWQKKYPICLEQYLGVRLWIAKSLHIKLLQEPQETAINKDASLKYVWLKAWEKSWQHHMLQTLRNAPVISGVDTVPKAQFVFCIDTRSELIRRHVEAQGNYETFGYAGFFGIAMDYTCLKDGVTRKSCPPILKSAYQVREVAQPKVKEQMSAFKQKNEISKFKVHLLKRMKNMLPSTFGFVEGAGLFYGFSLVGRTLFSGLLYRYKNKKKISVEKFADPQIMGIGAKIKDLEISLEEKVALVKGAFDLTGWKEFAPIVVFAGHGSHTANNAYASSLDCGACAASPGRHNARMLAKLANLKEVRAVLAASFDLMIPRDTFFIGAEHNTTTDKIELFDVQVPPSHKELVMQLKGNLKKAQRTATEERLGVTNAVAAAQRKANDWAQTRPEWGLAKNAGFIIAPRKLTKNTNLNSRCFLHSYDWKQDSTGAALEGIMQGPMVVTQWINNHYYFSTVDNKTFGGGSKITHNITGKFGVVQGNGGDLKMGLPLQSVNATDLEIYHQPLRLSVLINAPLSIIIDILSRNKSLKSLLDNEWIYLMVMDPTDHNSIKTYSKGMIWKLSSEMQLKEKRTRKETHPSVEIV